MNSTQLSIYVLMDWVTNDKGPIPNCDLEGYCSTFSKMYPREEFESKFILKENCSMEEVKDAVIKEYLNKKNKE